MKQTLKALSLVFTFLFLTACETLPQTFNERVHFTYTTLDAVVKTATAALEVNAITTQEARFVSSTVKEARALVVLAEEAFANGDLSTAEGRLQLATTVLLAIQADLREKLNG